MRGDSNDLLGVKMIPPLSLVIRISRDVNPDELEDAGIDAAFRGETILEYIYRRMVELDMAPNKAAYWAQLRAKRGVE